MPGVAEVAKLLGELVRFDTRNPGGDEAALAAHLCARLGECRPDRLELHEVPGGHVYVYAAFGTPRILYNAHLDTVPAAAGWSRPPHEPVVERGRLYGLGAADTKGAVAALLAALGDVRPQGAAILFSGDEESGGSAMRAFLASPAAAGIERAIVCEPTSLRAGTRHRGILSFVASAPGRGGHSSRADELPRPIAELARLAVALDDWGQAQREQGPAGFRGMCLNLAELRGGVAFNVVPPGAELVWSLRPPPGMALETVRAEMAALVPPGLSWRAVLENPAFATRELDRFAPLLGEAVRAPVDLGFWTEAAMLSAAGIDAVVFGPGDIGLAHAADEFVPLGDLEAARAAFLRMFAGT